MEVTVNDGPVLLISGDPLITYSKTKHEYAEENKRERQEIRFFFPRNNKKPSGLTRLYVFFSNPVEKTLFPLCL